MKRTIIKLCFLIISQISFGQECGFYKIKYIGKVNIENSQLIKIKLPSTDILSGKKNEMNLRYVETTLNNGRFECIDFGMTCSVSCKAKSYYRAYKKNRKYISINLIIIEDNIEKDIQIKIPWKKIKMKDIKDEKHGHMFEINLGKINLN